MLQKYKFHAAFENSNVKDYVTEKIFQALYAGTLPSKLTFSVIVMRLTTAVYMGAPNIDTFMPSNRSIIKVSDFEYVIIVTNFDTMPTNVTCRSIEELAEYIKYLDSHDDEYQKYFEWKKKDYAPNFKKIKEYITTDSRCKLCMKLHGLPIPRLSLTE